MARRIAMSDKNAPGAFYVGIECAGCGLCVEEAPSNFWMNERQGHSFVWRQPANSIEEAECRGAMAWCPVGAIGDDGLGFGRTTFLDVTSRPAIVN